MEIYAFTHEMDVRLPDEKPVLTAKIVGTALNERGRPYPPAELSARLATDALRPADPPRCPH